MRSSFAHAALGLVATLLLVTAIFGFAVGHTVSPVAPRHIDPAIRSPGVSPTTDTAASAVVTISATPNSPSAATITWPFTTATAAPFESYIVSDQPPNNTQGWVPIATIVDPHQTSWTATSLQPGATYAWEVSESDHAAPYVLGMTNATQPAAGVLNYTYTYGTYVQFNWTDPAGVSAPLQFSFYQLWWSTNLGPFKKAFTSVDSSLRSTTLSLDLGYSQYSLFLVATAKCCDGRSTVWYSNTVDISPNKYGWNISSDTLVPLTVVPGVPLLLHCTEVGFLMSMFYNWTFGDGTTGTGSVVSHQYDTAGTYSPVCLEDRVYGGIEYGLGLRGSVIVAPWAVSVISSTLAAAPGEAIAVQSSADNTWRPSVVNITIEAPDAGVPTMYGVFGNVTFLPGAYGQVTVEFVDAYGGTGVGGLQIILSSVGASVTASSTRALVGDPVTFQANGLGGTGTGYRYAWTFGDGTSGSGASVTHAYAYIGTFNATVAVSDSLGGTGSGTAPPVSIAAAIRSTIGVVGEPISVGMNATLSANVTGGFPPYSCYWTFAGSAAGSAGCVVVHRWTSDGSFLVNVTATDAYGHARTDRTVVNVSATSLGPSSITPAATWVDSLALGSALIVGGATVALAVIQLRRPRTGPEMVGPPASE